MSNQHSRIYLCIESIVHNIVRLSAWCFRKFKGSSVIEFRNAALLAIATDLNLLGIYLVSSAKPSFGYP